MTSSFRESLDQVHQHIRSTAKGERGGRRDRGKVFLMTTIPQPALVCLPPSFKENLALNLRNVQS